MSNADCNCCHSYYETEAWCERKRDITFYIQESSNFTFSEKHKLCQIDSLSNQEIGVKPKLQRENLCHISPVATLDSQRCFLVIPSSLPMW